MARFFFTGRTMRQRAVYLIHVLYTDGFLLESLACTKIDIGWVFPKE